MSDGPNSIWILAVDDRPRFINGIAALLPTQPDMNPIAEPRMDDKRFSGSVRAARTSP
jgi:hypothetical protein